MTLTASVTNKLILARHLFSMSLDNLKSHREIALFATVNLMQDAIEAFLLALSEHLNAGIDSSTTFERYFDKVEARITPKTLPFRPKLVALNKVRIAAKHYGVKPDGKEVESFSIVCREFLDETCNSLFGVQFWSVSLIDLLDDDETKKLLTAAQHAFNAGDYLDCMIECRKALFIEYEKRFDIAKFKDGEPQGILAAFSRAPYYARNSQYIAESVDTPFDYIVIDHGHLDSELMADGIDTQVFWNIWRLTPAVYRYSHHGTPVGDWLVKRELTKEENASEEHAAYVLENTIDIVLHIRKRRRLIRYTGPGSYFVVLKSDGVKLYSKADRNSAVSMVTDPGLRKLTVSYGTIGLNGDGTYWYVTEFSPKYYHGYVHEEDVDYSKHNQANPEGPLEEDVLGNSDD